MDEQTNKFAIHAACREGKCESQLYHKIIVVVVLTPFLRR